MTDAPSSLSSRVAAAAGWMVAARFLIRLVSLIGVFVLARLLTPADFGVAAAATAVLMVCQGVTEMQFASALIRKRDIPDSDWDTVWTLGMARGILLAGVIVLAAGPLAGLVGAPEAAQAFAAMGAVALLSGTENPRFILFARALSLRQEFLMLISVQLLGAVATVGFALLRPDYWALIFGAIVAGVGRTAFTYAIIGYRPRLRLTGARALFTFSGWLMGASALNTINDQSDRFFVLARLDAAALGVFRVGQQLVMMPTTELIRPLTRGLFPAFSLLQDDPPRLRAAYMRAQQAVLSVGLPIGFGLPFVAAPLVALALGAGWEDAALIVQYLAPVLAVQMVTAGVEAAAMALGDTRRIFLRALAFAALRIPLLLAGVMLGGLQGLLMARIVTGLCNTALNLDLLRRTLGVPVSAIVTNAWRAWAAAAAMTAALATLTWLGPDWLDGRTPLWGSLLQTLACVALGGTVYAATLGGLWLAAGRPDGAERRLFALALGAAARLRQRKGSGS